jgi:hypothetical protein
MDKTGWIILCFICLQLGGIIGFITFALLSVGREDDHE